MAPGARPSVIRFMLYGPKLNAETIACPLCGKWDMQFYTGELGETLEQCPNVRCANNRPHRPTPSAPLKPKDKQKGQRTRTGSRCNLARGRHPRSDNF